MKNVFDV